MISGNPINKPTFLRRIAYSLFWLPPFRYVEEFMDPRPVGSGNIYIRRDRLKPRDQIPEDNIDNVQMMLFMCAQKLEDIKYNMRRRR